MSHFDPANIPDHPWQTWLTALEPAGSAQAAAPSELAQRLEAIERFLTDQVARRGPTCWLSGRCCHFEPYGHKLYLTGLEIAYFAQRHLRSTEPRPDRTPSAAPAGPNPSTIGPTLLPVSGSQTADGSSCPFLSGRACAVHPHRPLGCRIFFCQRGTQDWQQNLYEQTLQAVRKLHDDFQLPYHYMEWCFGLKSLEQYLHSAVEPA